MKNHACVALLLAALAGTAAADSYDALNAGIQLRNDGRMKEALPFFDKALAGNDLVPGLQFVGHFDRAQARAATGDSQGALDDLGAALVLRPGDRAILSARATFYMAMHKSSEAEADFATLINAYPDDPAIRAARAMVEADLGKPDAVMEDVQAMRGFKDVTRIRLTIGTLEWEIGKIDEAQADFTAYRSGNDADAYGWLWLALANARLGKPVPKDPGLAHDKWPAPVADYFQGKITLDDVLTAAQVGPGTEIAGQACEANFYAGEWLWQHHDDARAKPYLQKAADTCPTGFVESGPARNDVKKLP